VPRTSSRARSRPDRLTIVVRVLGLFGLLVLASTLTPFWNWAALAMQTRARLQPADAIVVLGSNAYADGTLNSGSLRRAIHGITLLHAGLAPRIVFTGAPVAGVTSEAAIRERLARDLRVPPAAILVDDRPRTTRDEAIMVAERLRAVGVTRILLVTGGGHMARARTLFEQQGLTVFPATVREGPFSSTVADERLELARIVLTELASHLYYRLAGYL
jgi:uncharacterized SAM-binding protein YcdF (DUF218 family)